MTSLAVEATVNGRSAMTPIVDVDLTVTGWAPRGEMSFEQWEAAGRELNRMARAINFWVGDWINYGERNYGEKYSQAIDVTGMEYQTLCNTASVAKRIPPERRRENLSWTHHAEVASLPPEQQVEWLDRADEEGMTVARLRSRLQGTPKTAPDPDQQLEPTHIGSISFKFVAESNEKAHDRVKELAALLERKNCRVTHKAAKPA